MEFVEIVIEGSGDPDDLEEAIAEAFAGLGEVMPSALDEVAGLDLELDRELPDDDVLERLFGVIDELGLGDTVKVRPADDQDWLCLSDWQA